MITIIGVGCGPELTQLLNDDDIIICGTNRTVYEPEILDNIVFTCDRSEFTYFREFDDFHKVGWNNPRKINLPKFNLNKKYNRNIRNDPPRKFKKLIP